ncbi:MAG: hypothetical protein AAFX79_05245 [Planctomycetota bacterium]
MAIDSYRALCSDMYVNLKLAFKVELETGRQEAMGFFGVLQKRFPALENFRYSHDELSIEAGPRTAQQLWAAVRGDCVRAGVVNPASFADAYALHRDVLEFAPAYLGLSNLDIDYYELLFGFDIDAQGDHDQIVFDAVLRGSPLGDLIEEAGWSPIDTQPVIGVKLTGNGLPRRSEAYFECKTRPSNPDRMGDREPISVYLTVRRHGPVEDIATPKLELADLASNGERILDTAVMPRLIQPIRSHIASGG